MATDRLASALATQARMLAAGDATEARLAALYDEFTRHFDALTDPEREQVHAARRVILATQESARLDAVAKLSPPERAAYDAAEDARRRANEADQRREEAAAEGLPPVATVPGMTAGG